VFCWWSLDIWVRDMDALHWSHGFYLRIADLFVRLILICWRVEIEFFKGNNPLILSSSIIVISLLFQVMQRSWCVLRLSLIILALFDRLYQHFGVQNFQREKSFFCFWWGRTSNKNPPRNALSYLLFSVLLIELKGVMNYVCMILWFNF